MFNTAIITVSDRGYSGTRPDEGGPLLEEMIKNAPGYNVIYKVIVPDERSDIEKALCYAADTLDAALILTTGGTGFAPRDITPEATLSVCDKTVPGIPEAMRAYSMKITPRGMLSRAAAGIRGRTLIVNLPGSPKAARENLTAVFSALEHGLIMLRGKPMDCAELS